MKRLFTLAIAVLAVLAVNAAKVDVGAPTNNVKDGENVWFDPATNKIHFFEANSYRPGWWLEIWDTSKGANVPKDASNFDSFVVELSDIPAGLTVSVRLEYEGTDSISSAVADADGKITVKLADGLKSQVKQAYLQADGEGECTFKAAYWENGEAEKTSITSWEGTAGPIDWAGNTFSYTFTDDDNAFLQVGNTMRFGIECPVNDDPNENYYQAQVMGSWWTILNSTYEMAGVAEGSKNAIITVDQTATTLDIVLNDKDVATLQQQKGVIVAGHGIIIKSLSFLKPGATGINNVKKDVKTALNVNAPMYNLAGQRVNKSYKGVVIQNGRKFMNNK